MEWVRKCDELEKELTMFKSKEYDRIDMHKEINSMKTKLKE